MNEQTVRSVLRLVAVLLVVFATVTMVPAWVSSLYPVGAAPGAGVRLAMSNQLLWAYLITTGSAVVLFLLSPFLARVIVR